MINRIFFSLFFVIITMGASIAQKGNIRGTVIDDATGEALFGVTVVVAGTTTGAVSDFDGKFDISLDPGTYTIQVSFVSYATVTISEIVVNPDQVSIIDQIPLKEDVQQLEEIVITAEVIKNTEEALLTVKRKSVNVMDGISSVSFRKMGDSDAASAVKRVTGVSIEGGKYVYVRGLGDRYTKSILNGVDIPGLDPDRNTLQMDIFPTNVIDNIMILKSFSAELPADFVGGLVDIQLKDFPEQKKFSVAASLGYNPNMHFQSNFLTYNTGGTDFLGFDDGTRAIPQGDYELAPNYGSVVGRPESPQGQEYQSILSQFNPNLGAIRDNNGMDYTFGISYGDQYAVGDDNRLGFNVSFTYKNKREYLENVVYGRWGLNQQDPSDFEMDRREFQQGDQGAINVLMGGTVGLAYKTQKSKYRFNFLHLQNGESKAGLYSYVGSDQGSEFDGIQTNLEYSQRSLSNILFAGTHYNGDGTWQIDWKLSPTRSSLDDPDIRFTRLRTDNGLWQTGTESGLPERIWRFLEEYNVVSKVDAKREHQLFSRGAKLRFGANYTFKYRDYDINGFQINPRSVDLNTGYPTPPQDGTIPDPQFIPTEEIFAPDNLWPTDARGFEGTTYGAQWLPVNPNKYQSIINNFALYASEEAQITTNFKAILGVRMEKYQQRYSGQNQLGTIILRDSVVIDKLDLFPTLNLIYALNERNNLRFSFSRTTARPSFKEASFAEILDPITGRTFIGGFFEDRDNSTGEVVWDGKLTTTYINNIDLRWEIFRSKGQTYSLGGFYKSFQDPIEIVQYAVIQNSFQPRNVGFGQVLGVEFEFRQNLLYKGPHSLSTVGNITVTESSIEMSDTEYNSRVANAREGQTIDRRRQMAGQAPYIFNVGLAYEGFENGLEAGIYYNVQGETLRYVGITDRPDIFSVPFNSLNLTASYKFGSTDQMRIALRVTNLLDDDREEVFKSFNAQDQIFGFYRPRTEFSVGFKYDF